MNWKFLALAVLVCSPFVLWAAGVNAQDDAIRTEVVDIANLDTSTDAQPLGDEFFFPAIPVSTEQGTWGRLKTLWDDNGVPKVESMQTDSMGGAVSIGWPFRGDLTGWYGWEGSRSGGATGRFCGGARTFSHSGADYYARDLSKPGCLGTRVYAGMAGQVVKVGSCGGVGNCDCGYGIYVVIYDWNRHVAVRYAHLQAREVNVGQWVSLGTPIGRLGETGCAYGAHLHLAAYENIDHFSGGYPVVPGLCDSDYYACAVYFYCWQ